MGDLLNGKVIIVTGAGRGIGQAMATVYAENGATVYANDILPGMVEEWCGDVNARVSGKIYSLPFDITSETEARTAIMQVKKDHIMRRFHAIEQAQPPVVIFTPLIIQYGHQVTD